MSKPPIHTVLTGDLIKSRRTDTETVVAAFSILQKAATDFGKVWHLDLRFTRYRGDGWQIVLTDPQFTLDAILYFIATLRAGQPGVDTRISVGIGPVETLGTRDLSDATGPAFFISGDQLDQMSRKRLVAIAGHGIGPCQIAIVDLAECIATGWTAAQAQAVDLSLQGDMPPHEDIAAQLGITRQAVQSRLSGAGFGYFETAIYAMRNHDFTTPKPDPN